MKYLLKRYKELSRKERKGFTLVELLVVIAILAVLASVSVVGYLGFTNKARHSNALTELAQARELIRADLIDGAEHYYTYDSTGTKWSSTEKADNSKPSLSLQYAGDSLTYTFTDSSTASNVTWNAALKDIFEDLNSLDGELQVTVSSTSIISIQYYATNNGKAQWTVDGDVLSNGDSIAAKVADNKIAAASKSN